MNNDVFFLEAVELATRLHSGQYRVTLEGEIPYIQHPMNVVKIVHDLFHVDDLEILTAAALHDVVEDCSKKFTNEETEENIARKKLLEHIRQQFGEYVEYIIINVTHPHRTPKEKQWYGQERLKKEYIFFVERAIKADMGTLIVKTADYIDNAGNLNNLPESSKTKLTGKYKPLYPIYKKELEKTGLYTKEVAEKFKHIGQSFNL